jgi:hypothetical protein
MPKNLSGGSGAKKRGNEDSFRRQRGNINYQRYLDALRNNTTIEEQLELGKVIKTNGGNAQVFYNHMIQSGVSISGNVKKSKPKLRDEDMVLLEGGQIIAIIDRRHISEIENNMKGEKIHPRIKEIESELATGGCGFNITADSEDEEEEELNVDEI